MLKGGSLLPVVVAGVVPFALFAVLILGTSLMLVEWRPPLLWSDQFGALGHNAVTSVAVGPNGVFATGFLNSTRAPQNIPSGGNYFVREYSQGGSLVWSEDFPVSNYSIPIGLSAGTDGVYDFLATNDTYSLLKYDFGGSVAWTRQFRGQIDESVGDGAVSVAGQGVFVAGIVRGPITNQTFTGFIAFVREYDTQGSVLWTSEFSNSTNHIADMYADSSGVYVLTDSYLLKYTLNGTDVWTRPSFGTALSGDSIGVYVSGSSGYFGQSFVGFLSKYDHDGNLDWTVHFDSPDSSGVQNSFAAAGSSGIVLNVDTIGGEIWAVKYDSSGNKLWSYHTSTVTSESVYSLAAGAGGFYQGGQARPSGDALVRGFSQDSSLVFFGLNPPWSFIVLSGIVSSGVAGLFYFYRLQRRRSRPPRIGLPEYSLPARD